VYESKGLWPKSNLMSGWDGKVLACGFPAWFRQQLGPPSCFDSARLSLHENRHIGFASALVLLPLLLGENVHLQRWVGVPMVRVGLFVARIGETNDA